MNMPEENLKELFGRFMDAESAQRAAEDIDRGEAILRANPAPRPDEYLVADIKAGMQRAAIRNRRVVQTRRLVWEVVAVAATVTIAAGLWLSSVNRDTAPRRNIQLASLVPAALWESDDVTTADADLAMLTAEVNQIEDELVAVRLDEGWANGNGKTSDLEMELIEVNSDFWKG